MDKLPARQSPHPHEELLHRIANRIRQSLELQEILNTTAVEVRDYLKTDRVKIYRFNPDSSGVVIAESIDSHRLPSLSGLHFPADDIPPYARELFLKARQRSIVDVINHTIGLSLLDHPETGEAKTDSDIRYRPLDPCHAEYLRAMGVNSSVVVPIVLKEHPTENSQRPASGDSTKLWGLLACHHSEPRSVTEAELEFIQAVVDQVGVAIAQSILLDQVRAQAEQEANINRVTKLLYTSTPLKLQAALEEAVATFDGSGGRLYLLANETQPRELCTCGKQPMLIHAEQNRVVEENFLWRNFLHSVIESSPDSSGYRPWSVQWMRSTYSLGLSHLSHQGEDSRSTHWPNLWAVDNLYREPLFRTLAPFFEPTSVCSLLIIPLRHGMTVVGCLTIFRDEADTETLWAGYHNPDTRQLMARQSFEVWRQDKKSQASAWTEAEIKCAQALGERFATAVEQYRLHQQIQAFNANLEQQVEERTQQLQLSNQELENSFSRQKALVSIVSKIRESLEIEEIFRITTKELSQILTADRVAVYQFDSDWGGDFVADFESVTPRWMDIGPLKASTIWNDTHLQETQGGRYRHGEVFVVDNVYQQGFSQCHLDLYEKFQIKAFITVPIFVGQNLWGILCSYQHKEPRHWEASEVDFANQIAAQLSVALQHASLLAYNRRKTEELSNTLSDLKETQTQLIQTEKMSSLGQLVAGIAHEINNPVNFIHANLVHLEEYSNSLLETIASYQAHYPEPDAEISSLLEDADVEYIAADLPKLCSSLSNGTRRIQDIVSSLRSFSRLDESDVKAVDLHEGLESTLLILRYRLKLESSKIVIEVVKEYGELPLVECHPGQINQVFMNLLANAIDELQTPSISEESALKTITITTELAADGWVNISIKDDGNGIPEAALNKLFDPFFTTKPVGKGTGLGLSISYKIVEEHGGRLSCESELGKGTIFTIKLPIRSVLETAGEAKTAAP